MTNKLLNIWYKEVQACQKLIRVSRNEITKCNKKLLVCHSKKRQLILDEKNKCIEYKNRAEDSLNKWITKINDLKKSS